jgi:hypothetical protein
VTVDQLADATIPIAIVEGEKKALALERLAKILYTRTTANPPVPKLGE